MSASDIKHCEGIGEAKVKAGIMRLFVYKIYLHASGNFFGNLFELITCISTKDLI